LKMLDEKTFEKFMYGHPTINGKDTIYQGRKVRKKVKVIEPQKTYDLVGTVNVLSNILLKGKKNQNGDFENNLPPENQKNSNEFDNLSTLYKSQTYSDQQSFQSNLYGNENRNMNNYNMNNNNMSTSSQQNNGLLSGIVGELEREVIKANRGFSEREKAMNLMNNLNANTNGTNNVMKVQIMQNQVNNPPVKRKRGRPPKNTINASLKSGPINIPNNPPTTQNPTTNPNPNQTPTNNTNINTNINTNNISTPNPNTNPNPIPSTTDNSLLEKKKDRTPRKYTKRFRGKNFSDLYRNRYYGDPLLEDNENNDMNLLEILFKEYGYNNIVYVLTDSPEIKLGETKIKKIKNGLNTLLGCENNVSRVIETIVKMRKSNLIDESWIKGKYNYRTRNKNNFYIASYHYQLDSDGFIYKFKHHKILHDGSIRFKCCDPKCNGRGLLFPRIKKFKMFTKHSLAPLQHDYLQNGYDKFAYKMEMKCWKEMSLKDNPDDKKSYIDWHRPFNEKKV